MSSSLRLPLLPLLLFGALACTAETFGADDRSTLVGATITGPVGVQWPGSEILLRSDGFADLEESAGLFTSEGLEAAAVRVDPTTFRVRLPEGLVSGRHSYTLRFWSDSGTGVVETAGYRNTIGSGAGRLESDALPWPWDAPTGVLATDSRYRMIYIDGRTGRSTPLTVAGYPSDIYSAGTSYRRGVVITRGSAPTSETWLTQIDLFRGMLAADSAAIPYGRQVYEISPETYVLTGSHRTSIYGPRGSAFFETESPWYFLMSPDRKYGTFVANALQVHEPALEYALPIIDLWTGSIARAVPGIGSTDAGAWGHDSKSLYVAARPHWYGPQRLVRIDPETGLELASAVTEHGEPWGDGAIRALATDPRSDLLYELSRVQGQWQLNVRDLDDLAIVGSMRAPASGECGLGNWFQHLIVDPTGPSMMVLVPGCTGVQIHRFDLPY
jgi:hypothetical protein